MKTITKKYALAQLNKFKAQKQALKNIVATAEQRKQLNSFYDKEINLWQGWANTFSKINGPKADTLTVTFEQL